jgi:hypothetical protein
VNLHLELRTTRATLAKDLAAAEPEHTHANREDDSKTLALPSVDVLAPLVAAVAGKASDPVLVTIGVHETTQGRGFRPGHVFVAVSKLDPKAKG